MFSVALPWFTTLGISWLVPGRSKPFLQENTASEMGDSHCLEFTTVEVHPFTLNFNTSILKKFKIIYNFGLSECNRVKKSEHDISWLYTGRKPKSADIIWILLP